MMKRIVILFILMAVVVVTAKAQGLSGRIIDNNKQPVEGVAVILQTLDTLFVDAALTDSLGCFTIPKQISEPHRLLCQHLLYHTLEQEVSNSEAINIVLEEKDQELAEVVVKGERPLVRVENGALKYDMSRLLEGKTATNAFEAVKELPGIIENNERFSLVGARTLHIIINGQQSSMTQEQLLEMLKSIPASRIEKADIIYNAPAKYNVKGAMINLVINKGDGGPIPFQGEITTSYTQRKKGLGSVRGNILYTTDKLTIDLLANGSKGKSRYGEEMIARHTLGNTVTEIEQSGFRNSERLTGDARLGIDYNFTEKDQLSFAYYISGKRSDTQNDAITQYTVLPNGDPVEKHSTTIAPDSNMLHNVSLRYSSSFGLIVGGDYTYFRNPSATHFINNERSEDEADMQNFTRQQVSRYNFYANQTHEIGGWGLNYGVQGGYARSKNYLSYAFDTGNGYRPDPSMTEDNVQQDYTGNVFTELSGQIGERFNLSAALKAEYFKSDYKSLTDKTTLWEEWALFPTLTSSYTFTPHHILQFNISSDKVYPSYWELSPQRTPLNSYSEVAGNPLLKPYRSYEGQLIYIFRQKYMLIFSAEYEPDYFTQMPYQSADEMKNVFRFDNIDYATQFSVATIIPFRVGSFWSSRLVLNAFRMRQKSDDFHGLRFNRAGNVGVVMSNNTFLISEKPKLSLTLDGQYVTEGGVQGVFDLGRQYSVSAGLKYTFANDQGVLAFTANDIFNTGMPNPITVNYENQWSRMSNINDLRYFRLSFTWKFGSYKKRDHEAVDTSRFRN